jgi:tRNA(Arg) A34 adenosine deaminase TadA
METALKTARSALASGNYPVGAVVERDGEIISTAFTELSTTLDPTAHAEVLAIRRAAAALESRKLSGCVLYTTLEPCPMCAAAAIWARMRGIVFGATQLDGLQKSATSAGSRFSWRQIKMRCVEVIERDTPRLAVQEGFLREQCLELMELT